jgi:hypothetical protein
MIEFIFTLDYEIYGNGQGSLRELVYDPAARLKVLFDRWDMKFVAFVEAVELERIQFKHADEAIYDVRRQIKTLHQDGFEIALHLHPQWANARLDAGQWILDYSEYNLCTLPRSRIESIVDGAINYLREVLQDSAFIPTAFRAGNWLFQPTATAAAVLADRGIRVDSSVFKGGMQRQFGLDYRPAARNDFYWRFQDDININRLGGHLLEIPIFTQQVPFWRMLTAKRVGMQSKTLSASKAQHRPSRNYLDYARLMYPMKVDFCRMTFRELKTAIEPIIRLDRDQPEPFKPLVAIGHTKDLVDLKTIESFLSYLTDQGVRTSTFSQICKELTTQSVKYCQT